MFAMKQTIGFALASMLLACSGAVAPVAGERTEGPAPANVRTVAVELFTSQGCSSCPPADAVLERLSREPNVVVLSRPVTYWDRLGWTDTLARPENDRLQNGYNQRFATDQNYTPQAVVDGRFELVGGEEAMLRARVGEAQLLPGPALRVERGAVTVSGAAARPAEVRLVALRGDTRVAIGRGENDGRTGHYTNVVLADRAIGTWRGGEARIALPADGLNVAGADRYAIVVQEAGAGPILGVSYL